MRMLTTTHDPQGAYACAVDGIPCAAYSTWLSLNFGFLFNPANGNRSAPIDPPNQSKLDRWDSLSEDCQKGLTDALSVRRGTSDDTAAVLRVNALNRALSQKNVLTQAGNSQDIDWTMLAAIGIRESSGFLNKLQSDGHGAGVFQIDSGTGSQHPEVSQQQAMDISWAANWAAGFLSNNLGQITAALSDLNGSALTQALAASYNHGASGVIRDIIAGLSPDTHTTGHNYGLNIVNLMDCFH